MARKLPLPRSWKHRVKPRSFLSGQDFHLLEQRTFARHTWSRTPDGVFGRDRWPGLGGRSADVLGIEFDADYTRLGLLAWSRLVARGAFGGLTVNRCSEMLVGSWKASGEPWTRSSGATILSCPGE